MGIFTRIPADPLDRLIRVDGQNVSQDFEYDATILDRLMHRAHVLEFEGKSYRLKEAASRLTGLTKQAESKNDLTAVP